MATSIETDAVLILCTCGARLPLCRLYFCRYCVKLRCGGCVSHEVDSHYCPNCLENMPSAEAKLKRNRCVNCFDCPSCHHTLSTRATSLPLAPGIPGVEKASPKKVYYLACNFCRWTSRDVDIPDKSTATGGWREQDNPNYKRISSVLSYYNQLAQEEKRDQKKYSRKRGHVHLTDKYGLTSVVAKKRAGLSAESLSLKEGGSAKVASIEKLEPSTEVEPLPESYYTSDVILERVTTLSQRFASMEFQPTTTQDMYPLHKHLLIKQSQRCKECEHNLIKPEFNTASIKFKLQAVALQQVPEIRIKSIPDLSVNTESEVELTLTNPAGYITHVTLLPSNQQDDQHVTGMVVLPMDELVLAAADDVSDPSEATDNQDDPKIVTFRYANKIGFKVKVTPMKADSDIWISFRLKYDYTPMKAIQGPDKEPDTVWLDCLCYLNLGPS